MNGRPVTDAQIAQALRAHLPDAAMPGLRERVFDAAETTAQLRSFPSFLGALSDADPVARRRSLLIAASLLLAVALVGAAAVGAWRLLQRNPIDELSLEPPADVRAFVLSSYERLPQLPPLALTWQASDSTKGRIYVDRSGAVRFDRFASADATEPAGYRILSPDHRISGVATVDGTRVWVEPGHEAIGDDPRVFLRTVLSADEGPGCEIERDPGAASSGAPASRGTPANGWRYVGLESVVGRPTHHVACAGDVWIDIETGLILRTKGPAADDTGQPIPVDSTEITEIAFGDQPAALFQPPDGVRRVSEDEYIASICGGELPNEIEPGISECPQTAGASATPSPEPSPTPTPTAPPNTSQCVAPARDPGEPVGPLAWTTQSMKKDWPVAVRPEPVGGGNLQPVPLTYLDPAGDAGSIAYPCIDIRGVMANTSEVHLKLVSNRLPDVDPADLWIAYGVVTDEDRDGAPDWRYGIDNVPDGIDCCNGTRVWRTNLHTGRTDDRGFRSEGFQQVWPNGTDAKFTFGGTSDVAGRGPSTWGIDLDMPFYAWASVIVNGRVVATDYAPDSGWLTATRGAMPGGTFLLTDPFPHLSMTVPDGWTGDASSLTRGDAGVRYAGVRFTVIDDPEDLCSDTIKPPLGPDFDDLVTYLEDLPSIDISESADVTIDGFRGRRFHYTALDSDGPCTFGGWLRDDVWILDVDGVRLLIASESDGDVPDVAVRAEIRTMVESIHFER